jgi:hypothetical protein
MASEKYLSDYFAMSYYSVSLELMARQECTFHRRAKTLVPKDMKAVQFFENELGVGLHPNCPNTVG